MTQLTQKGALYEKQGEATVRCVACGHRCLIKEGRDGTCGTRFNRGGELFVPFGYVAGLHADPIEKKPFFHAYPGSVALSFGMLGCSFHCYFCQNWVTSQALRESVSAVYPELAKPEEIVEAAKKNKIRSLSSTYNEPLITSEWANAVFTLAKKEGIATSFVSNGYATPEVLRYLRPSLDLFNVDLKTFSDKNYRKLGGKLQTVCDSIKMIFEMGFWLEIVTLVVPDFNDSDDELKDIANFLAKISPDIPWHTTAYHKDYRATNGAFRTPTETLLRAVEIGKSAGLRYVYAGNIHGETKNLENTYCPSCDALLIERYGFQIFKNRVVGGACPDCKTPVAGRWD